MPMNRRSFLTSATVAAGIGIPSIAASEEPVRFGLTPVFLTNDQLLVDGLRTYLANALSRPVKTHGPYSSFDPSGDGVAVFDCQYRELYKKGGPIRPALGFDVQSPEVTSWRERCLTQESGTHG